MTDPVIRTVSDLLQLFRDGQGPSTIPPADFRDMIVSLHPATGNFQDIPRSASGLSSGRLWLNGDILQISSGTAPQQPAALFSGQAIGGLSARAVTRQVARAIFTGAAGLSSNPLIPSIFFDGFDSLSLFDMFTSTQGTWYPVAYFAPDYTGKVINNTWMVNPFNPSTPAPTAYTASGGQLHLLMQATPPALLSATGGKPYLGQQLIAPGVATFGKFEARLAIPALNGTLCSFFLISNSGGANPVTTEINLEMVTGANFSPRTEWQFAIPPPGYPPGVPAVAEYHSYYPGAPIIDLTQMNVFTFDMRPTYVACSVNGTEVMRVTPPAEFGHNPWDIYLYQSDGGDWTGPLDAVPNYQPYLIDYVRVTA